MELGWTMGEDELVMVEDVIVDGDESVRMCLVLEDRSGLLSANVCTVLGVLSALLLNLWRGTACSSRERVSSSTAETVTNSRCVA